MYRQVFIPSEQNHLVAIPRKWFGYEIEVIVFPTKKITAANNVSPRQGWAEAAQQMHLVGDDALLLPSAFNDENTEWWTWEE